MLLFVVAVAVIAGLALAADVQSVLVHLFFLWWVPFLLLFGGILLWLHIGRDKTPKRMTKAERAHAKQLGMTVPERED
ncbi:MAG: hypothetical protein AAGA06_12585 [Pseudomonadota bacterium]